MKNISVIGAGTMGNGIAHVFAQNGYQVNLIDVSQNALDKIAMCSNKQTDKAKANVKPANVYVNLLCSIFITVFY